MHLVDRGKKSKQRAGENEEERNIPKMRYKSQEKYECEVLPNQRKKMTGLREI